jgi:broad specificity phosphatase PhoE
VEAQLLARRISTGWLVDAVFCSPMGRSIETAQAIADTRGLTPTVLPQLNDIDYGDWQFKTHDEIRRTDCRTLDTWFKAPHKVRFPRGESLQDVAARAADALRVLFTKHADDVVVIVAHDSTNRVMLTELLDMPLSAYWRFEQTPCCINEIDMMPDAIRLLSMNDTAHLAAIETC